ncbi:MAG: nucleotidyltransferase family protein [Candidatus Acidiferrum sp.]
MNVDERFRFLHWLDRSGLALSFLRRLQNCQAASLLPAELLSALVQRLGRNNERLRDMLQEFHRIHAAFHFHGVFAATLKGYSLIPDFCEDPSLRHQTDFDFLVAPASVESAAEALQSCGYSTARLSKSSESCFTTPLLHVPTQKDDLYAVQAHRQVDLHVSMVENYSWLSLEAPDDCLARTQAQKISDVSFFGLSLEDKFLVQIHHAFRHSFRSWIRLSWLLEIGRCVALHRDNPKLWDRVILRAGDTLAVKRAVALVLYLTQRLFRSPIPPQLKTWWRGAVTPSMLAWLNDFSVPWALADWPGSLSNLFLAKDFIPDRKLRLKYLQSRIVPRKAQTSLGSMAGSTRLPSLQMRAAQLRYVTHRSGVHLRDILRLPLQHLRWKQALRQTRASADADLR